MNEMMGSQKDKERDELDFYATHPSAIKKLIELENIKGFTILENSAGNGHLVKPLKEFNKVFALDIIERDYQLDGVGDFLKSNLNLRFDYAIYNPPFKLFIEFVNKTFEYTNIQWVFGRIQILESKKRYNEIFKNGYLEKVYIFSNRMSCAKGGIETEFFKNNSMVFCWYKFNKNFKGNPTIDWIVFD